MQIPKPFFKTCSLPNKSRTGYVLVLDAGTTGVKAFVFDGNDRIIAKAYKGIGKQRPKSGWVEQDALEILRASKFVLKKAVRDSGIRRENIQALGITNQREATVLWDSKTGRPVYPVIGWEDTRTRAYCRSRTKTVEAFVRDTTGLPLDPYFSASKIRWILRRIPKSQALLKENRLMFGTIDSWLIWNLCEDHPHVTDETNASRTLLFDLRRREWSEHLLNTFEIPRSILPRVCPSRAHFGRLNSAILGKRLSVVAVCGDQQASSYAAQCVLTEHKRAVTKVTYGTGVFLVQILGSRFIAHPPFFTTLVPTRGNGSVYALEAKIEGSGETVAKLLPTLPRLLAYFSSLAKKVDRLLQKLPNKPNELIIDGGVARDGYVVEIQEKTSGIPACLQDPFDGTALGCALLVWDSVD